MSTAVSRKPWQENHSETNNDGLHVIGVGLPRTGTTSLKAALEILGFEFIRAYDGENVDFYKLMKGYRSTVDAPTSDFYKEIHQAYPNAKLILTVRDSNEKWFESFQNTIGRVATSNFYRFSIYLIRFLRLQNKMGRKLIKKWNKEYGPITSSFHDQYNQRIINENKPEDLLVYNVKEGWPPLCKFLKVDIPRNIPFPNVNDTKDFNGKIMFAKILGMFSWIMLGLLSVFLLLLLWK